MSEYLLICLLLGLSSLFLEIQTHLIKANANEKEFSEGISRRNVALNDLKSPSMKNMDKKQETPDCGIDSFMEDMLHGRVGKYDEISGFPVGKCGTNNPDLFGQAYDGKDKDDIKDPFEKLDRNNVRIDNSNSFGEIDINISGEILVENVDEESKLSERNDSGLSKTDATSMTSRSQIVEIGEKEDDIRSLVKSSNMTFNLSVSKITEKTVSDLQQRSNDGSITFGQNNNSHNRLKNSRNKRHVQTYDLLEDVPSENREKVESIMGQSQLMGEQTGMRKFGLIGDLESGRGGLVQKYSQFGPMMGGPMMAGRMIGEPMRAGQMMAGQVIGAPMRAGQMMAGSMMGPMGGGMMGGPMGLVGKLESDSAGLFGRNRGVEKLSRSDSAPGRFGAMRKSMNGFRGRMGSNAGYSGLGEKSSSFNEQEQDISGMFPSSSGADKFSVGNSRAGGLGGFNKDNSNFDLPMSSITGLRSGDDKSSVNNYGAESSDGLSKGMSGFDGPMGGSAEFGGPGRESGSFDEEEPGSSGSFGNNNGEVKFSGSNSESDGLDKFSKGLSGFSGQMGSNVEFGKRGSEGDKSSGSNSESYELDKFSKGLSGFSGQMGGNVEFGKRGSEADKSSGSNSESDGLDKFINGLSGFSGQMGGNAEFGKRGNEDDKSSGSNSESDGLDTFIKGLSGLGGQIGSNAEFINRGSEADKSSGSNTGIGALGQGLPGSLASMVIQVLKK